MMKLNKKYFLPLTTLLIHVFFGINFTYAACEKEVSDYCTHSNSSGKPDFYSGCVKAQENTIEEEVERVLREEESKTENKAAARPEARRRLIDSIKYSESGMGEKNPGFRIISVMQFCQLKESLNLFDSRNQGKPAYSETVSNQSSNSDASSNQANSPQPSTQSENTQTNTSQQATKSKKGKKNPNDVSAKCVKLNHDKTKIVNMCSFPINITFCLMHQDDQTIQVTNSCNDGFVTETIYPGRAISDETLNTRLFSTACKHPSVSQNNKYIAFDTPPNGRCSQ